MSLVFSMAYAFARIYPGQVNGKPGKLFNPFASDQENALIYYLDIYKDMNPGK